MLNDVTNTFCYLSLPETATVSGMTNRAGSGWSRSHGTDRNLIAAVSNCWNGVAVSSFAYTNDALGRRTQRVDTAQGLPVTNVFAYNQRSEITNAAMGDADYSYEFDDIGNRERAAADAALTVYAANALNQYTLISNSVSSVVNPVYDLDGNMLTNGVWSYTWDAENRMVSAVSEGATVVSNAYDYLSRRVRKEVYAWDSQLTAYRLQSTASYVWDGWNIAAEIVVDSVAACTNVHFYTWGLDLSGSLQGAGGVGGLLADTRVSSDTSYLSPLTYYPTYDANGNVTEYVDVTGAVRARYAYSAFGETTSQSCDMAGAFTHRFSTKPFDTETGVSKYQLRDYLPGLGRWASRDPIGEKGGLMLYSFLFNTAGNKIDILGLAIKQAASWGPIGAGMYFPGYTFSVIEESLDERYNRLEKELVRRLTRLCPTERSVRWKVDGKMQCCTQANCIKGAKDFAADYVGFVRKVYEADYNKNGLVIGGMWGNIFGGLFSWPCGGYDRQMAEEYEEGRGLVCGGWESVAEQSFSRTVGKNGCFGNKVTAKEYGHTLMSIIMPNGFCPLDPWPSGGANIFID